MTDNYNDIIDLPHFEPKYHKRMSTMARAAQFAPFAALTGHDAAIAETARLTDDFAEIDDETMAELNRRMAVLQSILHTKPQVSITFFEPDSAKSGGAYRQLSGRLRTIDHYNHTLVMTDGAIVPIKYILDINSPHFE